MLGTPSVHPSCYIAPNANIVGDVELGRDCTVLFNATLRGDCHARIVVGDESNIQENACLHVGMGVDTIVGKRVTIGHGAIVHGCVIEDSCIIGMGSMVIDGAHIGKHCLIGAGALVTGTADIPDGMLVLGHPARAVRPLTEEEIKTIEESADEYVNIGRELTEAGVLLREEPFD